MYIPDALGNKVINDYANKDRDRLMKRGAFVAGLDHP